MKDFVQSAMCGKIGRTLQFMVLLLLVGGVVLYVTALTACYGYVSRSVFTTRGPAIRQAMSESSVVVVQEVVEAWHLRQYISASPAVTVTQPLCQEWVNFLQSEDTFIGFRVPYREPVIMTNPLSATLRLIRYTGIPPTPRPVMTGTLEYRPERAAFMQKNLPSQVGEYWVPLGLRTDSSLVCPSGDMSFGRDSELFLEMFLDMDATERIVPVYLCYEGEAGPPRVSAADLALARVAGALGGVGALGFQGEGITCLGPHQESLKKTFFFPLAGQWQIGGPVFAAITRTQTISLHLYAWENVTGTVSLTFQHSSDLGPTVRWGLYRDPAGQQPITAGNPLVVSGVFTRTPFYAIATVPGDDTAPKAGPYSLVITATQEVTSAVHSVLLWTGAWTPPPGPAVYLPVVRKN